MSLQNVQVEFAELIITNEQQTELTQPSANLVIYQNNMRSHLISALQNTYPLIVQLIGENAFNTAARDYIRQYPSSSGNLDEYGEYFDSFMGDYPAVSHLVYLPEVAAFEWTCHTIYRAADTTPLDQQKLAHINEKDYPKLTFQLHPASSLLQFTYPILKIIDLCKGKIDQIDTLEIDFLNLLLIRRHREIVLTPLEAADYQFLLALQNGQALVDAIHTAVNINPSFQVDNKLAGWVNNNTIVDFTLAR